MHSPAGDLQDSGKRQNHMYFVYCGRKPLRVPLKVLRHTLACSQNELWLSFIHPVIEQALTWFQYVLYIAWTVNLLLFLFHIVHHQFTH